MSFSVQRSHLAALTAIGAALLLSSCAYFSRGAPAAATAAVPAAPEKQPAADVQAAPAPLWRVLDGGIIGGNAITGPEDIRFVRPVTLAARGPLLYVVDAGRKQLFRYDMALDRLSVLLELSGVIHGEVSDIFVAPDLSFYLADTEGGRVLHFDRDGQLIRELQDTRNIGRPVSIAVNDNTGYIFIADGFNDDVIVYNPAGALYGALGIRGNGPGQFRGITALAQGPEGYYVAARHGQARVQVMGFDGGYRESFQPDTVTLPTAIAVSSTNRAYVSDYLSDDIKVFDQGRLTGTLGGHGGAPGRFRRITDLWLDGNFLYVSDSLNGRVQILSVTSEELPPSGTP